MKWIHLGVAALNTTPLDWEGNLTTLKAAIAAAKAQGIKLLCLPELALTGYGCEDAFHAPYLSTEALEILQTDILPLTEGIALNIGLPVAYQGALYNCSAMLANGKLLGLVAKQHLAGDGIHYEPRYFKAWPTGVRVELELGNGSTVPMGDLYFDLSGVRVGFEICEDAWVADRPGVKLAQNAVDVILNPSASHFSFRKTLTRQRFVLEGSRAFHCAYAYANLLGNEAGRVIYDGEGLIAHEGQMLKRLPRFSFKDFTLESAWVELGVSQLARYRQTSFTPDFNAQAPIAAAFEVTQAAPGKISAYNEEAWEKSDEVTNEEFLRAQMLGLWDYLRKSGTRGYALSLSGGADSATCAAVVQMMVEAVEATQPERLRAVMKLPANATRAELLRAMLVCVYQPTKNSGSITFNAAKNLAEALGARFEVFDVTNIVEGYEGMMVKYLGRPLDWAQDNLTRQNLQARVRNPGIWAVANAEGRLLITTSNRSEAAVGYCTMDGDTAGSLAPIAGVGKPFVLQWNAWIAKNKLKEMHAICVQAPTAELKPAEFKQTDEADLMPYRLLDIIQKQAVLNKYSPAEIFLALKEAPAAEGLTPAQLAAAIEKYFNLWSRNQWKRERYAPSFHLDDENLDPRSFLRFPILSGNYKRELQKLKNMIH